MFQHWNVLYSIVSADPEACIAMSSWTPAAEAMEMLLVVVVERRRLDVMGHRGEQIGGKASSMLKAGAGGTHHR